MLRNILYFLLNTKMCKVLLPTMENQSLWSLFLRTLQSYFKRLDAQSPFKIVTIIRLSVLTIWYLSQRGWVFVQPVPLNYF